MATKIEKVSYEGGKEHSLSAWGGFILFLGFVCLLVGFIAAGHATKDSAYDDWAENGLDWLLVLMGFAACIQGLIVWLVLTGGAEIIRLLKKLNGLDYGGSISSVYRSTSTVVSDYGKPVGSETADGARRTQWRCTANVGVFRGGACNAINPMESNKCRNCGAPRPKQ